MALTNALTGEPITNDELLSVTGLVIEMQARETEIKKLETELSSVKERYRRLSEELIPETMGELGLQSITLDDGTQVKVTDFFSGKIPEEKKDFAFAWLEDNGYSDLIKDDFSVKFGKAEHEEAELLADVLTDRGLAFSRKVHVHPMTLKSFIRELYDGGKSLPEEGFDVFIGKKTKLTK